MSSLVDLYLVYRILRKLTTPFNQWDAYKTGVIDAEGNLLKKNNDRNTQAERQSFSKFDLMILKLKKLLEKIPGGRSKFASYAAALLLIKEGEDLADDDILLEERLNSYLEGENSNLVEEIANVAGGSNIAGFDGNHQPKKKVVMRRFANNDVFVVDTKRYLKSRFGKKKYRRYDECVGDDEVGCAIREYGLKYPNRPIIIEDEMTGAMLFLRYGKTGMFTGK